MPVTAGGADATGALEPGTGVTGAGWAWFAAVHVPLLWRRRAPSAVFWAVLGLVAACVLVGGVTGVFLIFVPLFAMYAVARHRPARHLWPAAGATAVAMGLGWARDDPGWPVMIGVGSLTIATALAGVVLRMRRAYLEDRARHLERERDQQALLAVAAERARIAREVHDIVAHNLTVMVALADGATYATPGRASDAMAKVAETGREALSEMRRLVGLLRDSGGRDPQPGFADLDRLLEQVRAAGLRLSVTHEGAPGAWGPGAGLAVYRIVQEALTNTLKHAGPRARVRVRLAYGPSTADLEITDDGAGHAARPAGDGHGLAGMLERAAPYGGQIKAGPTPDTGWRVQAHLHFPRPPPRPRPPPQSRTPAPARFPPRPPALVRTPALLRPPALVRTPALVRPPTSVRLPALVQPPAPGRPPTSVRLPVPVRPPALAWPQGSVRLPVLVWSWAPVRLSALARFPAWRPILVRLLGVGPGPGVDLGEAVVRVG
ncbi:histidine kinase [Nonomuraea sp. NPDC050643]|uniref:sensor histidine kinase n=1 Tax=Nonomuraea sp. NPDC050643 TaxID=3155660 RepID=UPI0034060C2A